MEKNKKEEKEFKENSNHAKKFCIASLVLGIFAIASCWIPILGVVFSIIGLVISIIANMKRKEYGEGGIGFVITGLVCSILGIVIGVIISFVTLSVGTGMYTYYNKETTITTAASLMSQYDKDLYNTVVENYSSKGNLNGSDVKSMIDEITRQNSQYVNESGKFISIHADGITDYSGEEGTGGLKDLGEKANIYENYSGENNQSNIDKARNAYKELSKVISSEKKYVITTKEKDGIIYSVTIKEK